MSGQLEFPLGPRLVVDNVPGFAAWWSLWPRKIARADAVKAWEKLSAEDRVRCVQTAAAWSGYFALRESRFVPYPATFLRRGDYLDAPPDEGRTVSNRQVQVSSAIDGAIAAQFDEPRGRSYSGQWARTIDVKGELL